MAHPVSTNDMFMNLTVDSTPSTATTSPLVSELTTMSSSSSSEETPTPVRRRIQQKQLIPWKVFLSDINYTLGNYKTVLCTKQLCSEHMQCPYYHNTFDRRRPLNLVNYCGAPCTASKVSFMWIGPENCPQGDECKFCHSMTEQQFHPDVYKTAMCNNMVTHNNCVNGLYCALAHSQEELRKKNDSSVERMPVQLQQPPALQQTNAPITAIGTGGRSGMLERMHALQQEVNVNIQDGEKWTELLGLVYLDGGREIQLVLDDWKKYGEDVKEAIEEIKFGNEKLARELLVSKPDVVASEVERFFKEVPGLREKVANYKPAKNPRQDLPKYVQKIIPDMKMYSEFLTIFTEMEKTWPKHQLDEYEIVAYEIAKRIKSNRHQAFLDSFKDDDCVICMDEMPKHPIALCEKCKSAFHYKCLKIWLRKNPTCPTCRENM